MESLVIGLSGHGPSRELFWHLATAGLPAMLILAAFLTISRCRRAALAALSVSAAGGSVVALVFHHTYALPLWRGHASAIRFLDRNAFLAGFAASALACALGLCAAAAARRLARNAA
jgi:hypothetical protein